MTNDWYQRSAVIVLLIFGSMVANVFGSIIVDGSTHSFLGFIAAGASIGWFSAQINLVALWGSMAPGTTIVRLPWVFLLTVLMVVTFGWRFQTNDWVVVCGIAFITQPIAQIPFRIVSLARGYRVGFFGSQSVASPSSQFGIKSMMIGTALIALTLSLLRMAAPEDLFSLRIGRARIVEITLVLVPIVITNLVFITPSIWLGFRGTYSLRRLAITFVPFLVLAAAIEIIALTFVLGPVGNEWAEVLAAISSVNIAQCFGVYGVITLLRRFGFVLVSVVQTKAEMPVDPDAAGEG